jgi:cathepsin L
MNSRLLVVGLLIVLVQADDISWNSFQVKHNKVYKTQAEEQLRYKIFNDNLQKIKEHNEKYEQGLSSYTLGVNQFSDLTSEEFAATLTLQLNKKSPQNVQSNYNLTKKAALGIPDSIDWRTSSVVTGVKNQGSCGGCWAFSATGTIESQIAIQTGELKSLSEQQLLDCDTESDSGCNGGVVQYAIDYVTQNGLTLEDNYPFVGQQGSCDGSKSANKVIYTKGYVEINRNDESDLKQAVGNVGPVSVAINAIPIQSYQSGIFDGTCSADLDHAVLAVGYGTDQSTGVNYWIIKNSWGGDWGEQGYFRMKIGSNLCGIATQACYPLL